MAVNNHSRTKVELKSKYGFMPDEKVTSTSAAELLETCNAELLRDALARVVAQGDAIILSATRDGGAICLTILEGEGKHKQYAANSDELSLLLTHLVTL